MGAALGGIQGRIPTGKSKVEPCFLTAVGYGRQHATGTGSAMVQGKPGIGFS